LLYAIMHYCLIKGSSMLVFYAHGVGPVTLSGGFAESFFYGNSKPLPFTGRTETVSRKVGILECSRILRRSFPDNRFVFNDTFHEVTFISMIMIALYRLFIQRMSCQEKIFF